MPWNPDTYNKFKEERYRPFYDLVAHIQPKERMGLLDLGCGTGELTKIAADKFSAAKVLGIDSSAEMLAKAPQQENLSFAKISIQQQLEKEETWDVILANASLQWVEDHQKLFPAMIGKLNDNGQLAVQMPSQKENLLNRILHDLVLEAPYYKELSGVIRYSPVLTLDEYTSLLYDNGVKNLVLYQKVYPVIASSSDSLYDFIAGTALIPYMEKLDGPLRSSLEQEFKYRIAKYFTAVPAVYAFKRIILVAGF